MKTLILGDLHCRPIWKQIVEKEKDVDKIVFLGDYTCPREVKFDDPTDACGFLYEVLDFKDKNPDKVVLLRGNHDVCSIGYYWADCNPKDHPNVERYWRTDDVKNWFLNNTQWIYQIPDTNIVCSHAGVGEHFFNICKDKLQIDSESNLEIISELNKLEPSELFGFTPCKLSDYNGDSATQPCTWIRPYTLLHHGVKDIIQVVGHTPTKHICNIKDSIIEESIKEGLYDKYKQTYKDYRDVWVCDCIEHREYLIIEDRKFKPCKL